MDYVCPFCKKDLEHVWEILSLSPAQGAQMHAEAHLYEKRRNLLSLLEEKAQKSELPEDLQTAFDEYKSTFAKAIVWQKTCAGSSES